MRNLIWASATCTFGALLVFMAWFELGGMTREEVARGGVFVLLVAFALVAIALKRFVRGNFDEQGRWQGRFWGIRRCDRER